MCDFQVLFQDSAGYVIKCMSCKCLKMAFGNVVFQMNEIDLVNLCERAGDRIAFHAADGDLRTRKIYLTIPGNKIEMVFNIEELKLFNHILTESYRQNEINKLMQSI